MFVTKTRDSIALLEHRTLLDLVRMDLTSRLLQSCLQPQNAPTLSSYSSDDKENVPSLFEPVLNKHRVETPPEQFLPHDFVVFGRICHSHRFPSLFNHSFLTTRIFSSPHTRIGTHSTVHQKQIVHIFHTASSRPPLSVSHHLTLVQIPAQYI